MMRTTRTVRTLEHRRVAWRDFKHRVFTWRLLHHSLHSCYESECENSKVASEKKNHRRWSTPHHSYFNTTYLKTDSVVYSSYQLHHSYFNTTYLKTDSVVYS